LTTTTTEIPRHTRSNKSLWLTQHYSCKEEADDQQITLTRQEKDKLIISIVIVFQ
jgi:hypothetical protein